MVLVGFDVMQVLPHDTEDDSGVQVKVEVGNLLDPFEVARNGVFF